MRYTYNDLRKVRKNYEKNYLIKRWENYPNIKEAYKDMHRIYELMKYTILKNEVFKNISFIIAISNTGKNKHSDPCRVKINTKGRPKLQVTGGKKVAIHIHIACFGKGCPTFVKVITDKLNKKAYKSSDEFRNRKTKSRRLYTYDKLSGYNNGLDYVPYIYNQAEKLLTYGDLEFNNLKDSFFLCIDET